MSNSRNSDSGNARSRERQLIWTNEGNGRSRYTISGADGEMLLWAARISGASPATAC